MLAFIASGLLTHPEMVGLNPEYLHELMWGAAPRAALARALLAGKLFHFDINDGYRLKHDVDIGVGLVNPLDWLNVLVLLRSHGYNGPFNLDYKPPRTTSQFGVFEVSFPTAVDRFITLWEMAGEVMADPIIKEATDALKARRRSGRCARRRGDRAGQPGAADAARADRAPPGADPAGPAPRPYVFDRMISGAGLPACPAQARRPAPHHFYAKLKVWA